MQPVNENLNYTSAARIREVWPKRFSSTAAAIPYVGNPRSLANRVYANRMGNGPEASGDGWRYRGRALPQLTGEENYRKASKLVGVDLVADPEAANDADISAHILVEGMRAGMFTGRKLADFDVSSSAVRQTMTMWRRDRSSTQMSRSTASWLPAMPRRSKSRCGKRATLTCRR